MTAYEKCRLIFVLGVLILSITYFLYREPHLPSNVPSIPLGDQEGVHSKMLVPCGQSSVRIEFYRVNSGCTQWDGSNALLTIMEPYVATFDGETNHDHWDTRAYVGHGDFEPWLRATLHVDDKYRHKWLKAKAELSVKYPRKDRVSLHYFYNDSDQLCRFLKLFVVTRKEYRAAQRHANWELRYDDAGLVSGLLYPCGAILLLVGLIGLSMALYDRLFPVRKSGVKWFYRAADQGHPNAQFILGNAYATGLGVPRDYKEAAKWYRKAADQGHADAQSKLGILYYKGLGVPKDYVLSSMWFTLSGQMAEPAKTTTDAINAQVDLVDKMIQDQKEEANRLVNEWKRKYYSQNSLSDR